MSFKEIPEVEPDEIDKAMIAEAEKNYGETYRLDDVKRMLGYIDRQKAIDAVKRWDQQKLYLPIEFREVLEGMPPAEVPPIKRGRWIGTWSCSCCGRAFYEWEGKPDWNYCPICGADMRGEQSG